MVDFTRKTWADGQAGNTPITAADLNRHEKALADLTAAINTFTETFTPTTNRTITYTTITDRAIKAATTVNTWATTNNAKWFIGEFGWPADTDTTYDTRYDNEGDAFLTWCDTKNIPVTQWSSSEWGLDLKAYRNTDNANAPLSITTNVGTIKARHANKPSNTGVNLAGAEFGVSPTAPLSPARGGTGFHWSTQGTWQYLAGQGQKVIRLPFSWERMQPTLNQPLDATYLTALKQQLTYAETAGLKVIVDCHNYGRYTFADSHLARIGETYNGINMQAAFADLWSRLATELKNRAALTSTSTIPAGYGLMNEPHDLPIGANTFEAQTWQKAASAAHYAIRAAGDTTSGVMSSGYFYASPYGWTDLNGGTPWHYTYGPDGTAYAGKALNTDPLLWFEMHCYLDSDGGTYPDGFNSYVSEFQATGYSSGSIIAP